jgi:hypothetical protein
MAHWAQVVPTNDAWDMVDYCSGVLLCVVISIKDIFRRQGASKEAKRIFAL